MLATVLFRITYITDWIIVVTADVGNGIVACGNGNFSCYGEGDDQCCSTPSNVFSLGVATDKTTLTGPRETITTPTATTPTASTTFLRTSSAFAVLNTSTTSSTTSASTINPAAAVASTSIATSTPKTGLNRDVAIGLGLGVGVAVGLTILAGFLFFMRRRSKRLSRGPSMHVAGKNEMDAVACEKKVTRAHELMAERRFVELAGEVVRVELGGLDGPRAEMG